MQSVALFIQHTSRSIVIVVIIVKNVQYSLPECCVFRAFYLLQRLPCWSWKSPFTEKREGWLRIHVRKIDDNIQKYTTYHSLLKLTHIHSYWVNLFGWTFKIMNCFWTAYSQTPPWPPHTFWLARAGRWTWRSCGSWLDGVTREVECMLMQLQ